MAVPYNTHKKIKDVGRQWNQTYCSRPIGIGQISQHGGKKIPGSPSNSHQNGLDVDVRYVRKTGTGPLNVSYNPDDYDFDATQYLVNLFIDAGAEMIFVYRVNEEEDTLPKLEGGDVVREWSGHFDHFHVRFPKPESDLGNMCSQ